MSLLSDMSFAADATRMQAGGKSLFDTAYDAVTKAPVAATASALAGFYNTGAWYARKVFDQDVEDVQVTSMLEDFDANYVSYYQDNQNVLDTVGFIGGALVPGGAALKGLQLARAGKAGAGMAKILGYTSNQQTRYLKAALEEVGQTGGTVFHQLNMNKTMALAYGLVDNFVQTAVFETAAAGFLHQAPMLAGEDWKDVSWDIIKTTHHLNCTNDTKLTQLDIMLKSNLLFDTN